MTVTSMVRGHKIIFDGDRWFYADTGEPVNGNERPCAHCGRMPTPEGHDACCRHMPGVISACCGHGADKAYAILDSEEPLCSQ
jgi:hypothetical protein